MELYCYRAEVLRVIDGDSLSLNVRLGFDVFLKMSVRLYGIDTAETRSVSVGTEELMALGRFAKQFVNNLLPVGTEVTIKTS